MWKLDGYWLLNLDFLQWVSFAQQWAAIADKSKTWLKETEVPQKYQKYQQVFSEEGAKRLPPTRVEDMKITLKEDAPDQLDCKVYPLSAKELRVLRESLNEDLEKGYIKHSTSSYVSLIFSILKKDREELHMVIDYWLLNDMTKRDFYPLPNLHMELEKLSHYKLFSKFNVRAGYNNIRIKEEDQRKAAFKTSLETFIPTVMTFSNAPSKNERYMNK